MNREEQFLNYLDNELPEEEKREVESLLVADPEARKQMEEVRRKRQLMLSSLDGLNPEAPVTIPSFTKPEQATFLMNRLLRYAAVALVLVGITAVLWLVFKPVNNQPDSEAVVELNEAEPLYEDLDFYISPNRCWNERKLSIIIIKIK